MEKEQIGVICEKQALTKFDYIYEGIKRSGFDVFLPYYDYNIMLRCLREVWFRLHLPFKSIWYNKKILSSNKATFLIYDSCITVDFLKWLKKNTSAKLAFEYLNRVDLSLASFSEETKKIVDRVYSYDQDDCTKYGLEPIHPAYMECYAEFATECTLEYDILYTGRDKGRLQKLVDYENQFNDLGLKTYFHISPDRAYMRLKNKIYKPYISYLEYIEILKRSRAVLNIVQEGQTSITQRELEILFFDKKCITNNWGVLNFEFYDSTRYFILGRDDFNNLKQFLSQPIKPIEKERLRTYYYASNVIQKANLE